VVERTAGTAFEGGPLVAVDLPAEFLSIKTFATTTN
jgi:hypothetical protein